MSEWRFVAEDSPAVEVRRIGREAQPLVVIDGLMAEPAGLVDQIAATARFAPLEPAANFYPGVRAPAPSGYVEGLIRALRPTLAAVFGAPPAGRAQVTCALSIASLPADQANLIQRLPHIDSAEPRRLAILHYLCGPGFGGTAFYRHRATGFERVGPERSAGYFAALRQELEDPAAAPAGYVAGPTPLFDEVERVEAVFNRVIVYAGNRLHAGLLDAAAAAGPDPRAGRLTANSFYRFE
ncbi:MAG: hypothetical protein JWP92_131 [Caulobacter sp.]|nr:hypothetical protein [Caulobacter sp.]